MKLTSGLALAAAAFALVACATAGGLYHPAVGPYSSGYSEQKLETNRWRVTFVGTESTPASTVQDYALLRAADLTTSQGFDWFIVVGRSTVNQSSGYGPRFSGGFGPPCGVFGCYDPIYGGFWYEDYNDTQLSASLDIVMGKGEKPSEPDVYDAKDVAKTIRAGMKPGF